MSDKHSDKHLFPMQLDKVHRLMLDTLSTEREMARGALIRQMIRDEYFKTKRARHPLELRPGKACDGPNATHA